MKTAKQNKRKFNFLIKTYLSISFKISISEKWLKKKYAAKSRIKLLSTTATLKFFRAQYSQVHAYSDILLKSDTHQGRINKYIYTEKYTLQ